MLNFNKKSGLLTGKASENLVADIENIFQQGFTAIDAKTAYNDAMQGVNSPACKNLAKLFVEIAAHFEATGKGAGVSTIYNVIDARNVRKVKYSRKLAYNLQGSKALSAFAAIIAPVYRNENTRKVISVNGNEFDQNRHTYGKARQAQKSGLTVHATATDKPQKIRQFFDWLNSRNVPVVIE